MSIINIIQPYRLHGAWVFDDPRVGLATEPFVGGTDAMIDRITTNIPEADQGFVMLFSAYDFPDYQYRLDWQSKEGTGNIYYSKDLDARGCLYPALLRYFDQIPKEIFVQVRPKTM